GINPHLTIRIRQAGSVTHQPAGFGILTPHMAGSRRIRLSIQAIKTGKDAGRNGKLVRQMCTAEILSDPCRRWVRLGHSATLAQCPICPKADTAGRYYEYTP